MGYKLEDLYSYNMRRTWYGVYQTEWVLKRREVDICKDGFACKRLW